MPGTRRRFKKGDRVWYDDHKCVVLSVRRGGLTIRNKYGYKEDVKHTEVKLVEEESAV